MTESLNTSIDEMRRREAHNHPALRFGVPALNAARKLAESESSELFDLAIGSLATDPKGLLELSHALALWTEVMARLVVSGPGSIVAGAEVPGVQRPTDPANHAIVAAEVDALTFFSIGDLVLEAYARAELARRGDRGRSWPVLMRLVDAGPATRIRDAARRLDVSLRLGRTRLVAHPLPAHWNFTIWWVDGSVLVSRQAAEQRPSGHLVNINDQLDDPWQSDESMAMLRHVLSHADKLDKANRDQLVSVVDDLGFVPPTYAFMVADVLALVRGLRSSVAAPPANP